MNKRQQKKQLPKKVVDDIRIELNSTLSKRSYRQYYIVSEDEKIGYFGVYPNGVFFHSVIADGYGDSQVLVAIKKFIKEELHLTPIKR